MPAFDSKSLADRVIPSAGSRALYQLFERDWPDFLQHIEELGHELPKFVLEEVDRYLRCGILEHGCLHLVCRECGHGMLVAFSCKQRGICPSCLGRRMSDAAVHLVDEVLPIAPVRHWICSFPWGLRVLLGYDRSLCASVTKAFGVELGRWLARRAKTALGLSNVKRAHTGVLAAVQRTDGALASMCTCTCSLN